jgi:ketosteroid isomerase-like protein
MSQENVEVVRRMLELFNSGDVEAWLGAWDSRAEWMAVGFGAVEGQDRVYRGHSGLRRFRGDVLETFAEMRVAPSKLYDLGDVVVVLGEFRAKGATSGAAFAAPMGWRFEVRDRKVVHGRDYLDHASALEDAGLLE